jgi:apolipoprotein N-acyltransferase
MWPPTAHNLWVGALVALPLLAPGLLRPLDFTTSAGTSGVTLLQTAVRQDEKFDPARLPRLLEELSRALREGAGPLVVGPETAVPLLPTQLEAVAPGWWQELSSTLAASGRTALLGVPLGSFEQGYTNSVVALGAGAAGYRYDKAHLVPFGEFIPTGFRWFTELMDIPLGDFNRGPLRAPSFAFDGQRLAPNICYEDLFGEELALRFVDARQAPTALVNLSNIAWFGDTIALPQHLIISRMRALEFQRPMLRATNTGATAIVDHRGRVSQALPFHRPGALVGRFDGRTGLTPYAWWASRLGLWPLVAGATLVCLWAAAGAAAARSRGCPPP